MTGEPIAGIYTLVIPKRDATKAVMRAHARWLRLLQFGSIQTMRRVCHEIAILEDENRQYRDSVIFSVLRKNLEFVIQDVGGTNWSVSKSRQDMRGKTRWRRRNHVDHKVQEALSRRLSPFGTMDPR